MNQRPLSLLSCLNPVGIFRISPSIALELAPPTKHATQARTTDSNSDQRDARLLRLP
jgi:hypothetical protein